jgi:hypothetical protein
VRERETERLQAEDPDRWDVLLYHCAVWLVDSNVSEEYIASIFKTDVSGVISYCSFKDQWSLYVPPV